jgi:hypothetical protein
LGACCLHCFIDWYSPTVFITTFCLA